MTCARSLKLWLRVAALGLTGALTTVGCGGSSGSSTKDAGAPSVTLDINPMLHDFGLVTTGTSAPSKAFLVKNTSTVTSGTLAATVTGAGFSIEMNGCTGTLAANATCTVTVGFKAGDAGKVTGSLDVKAAGSAKAASAMLSAESGKPPALSVSAVPAFGSTEIDARSMPATVTVENSGSTTLTPTVGTAMGDFHVVMNMCTAALMPMGKCTFQVVFQPTRAGLVSGSVQVTAPGATPQTVSLSGMAVPKGSATWDPPSQLFTAPSGGMQVQTFTLRSGDAALSGIMLGVSGANATQFTPPAPTMMGGCGATLAARSACTVTVTFKPTMAGMFSATLAATANGGSVVTSATLTGKGQAPARLAVSPTMNDYGSAPVGSTSAAVSFTVTNDGEVDAAGVAVALAGAGASQFAIGNNTCGAALRAGQSCMVTVTFKPTMEGAKMATLSVMGTGMLSGMAALTGSGVKPAAIGITPAMKDFMSVTVGQSSANETFTVTNNGAVSTTELKVLLSGDFSVQTDACTGIKLAPMATCAVAVAFAPKSMGMKATSLTVVADVGGSVSSQLSGTGVAVAGLAVTPISVPFGAIAVTQVSAPQTVTITNGGGTTTGSLTVSVSSPEFVKGTDNCSGKALAAAETCTITYTFNPTQVTASTATLTVSGGTNVTATATFTGSGVNPAQISFVTAAGAADNLANLGSSAVGTATTARQTWVRNGGTSATGTLATTITGAAKDDYSVEANSDTCAGAVLPPGGMCTLKIIFKPTAGGSRDAAVNVTSAMGGTAVQTLAGNGLALLDLVPLSTPANTATSAGSLTAGSLTAGYAEAPTAPAGSALDFASASVGTMPATGIKLFHMNARANTSSVTVTLSGGGVPPNFAFVDALCMNGANAVTATLSNQNQTITVAGLDGSNAMLSSCVIAVRFQPQSPEGDKTATISAAGSAGQMASHTLKGTAVGPLVWTPPTHNFGNQAVGGAPVEQIFTLRNNGSVTFTTVVVSISDTANFQIVNDTCAGTDALKAAGNAGDTCTVTVRYIPGELMANTAKLSAAGTINNPPNPVQMHSASASVSGTGTPGAQITVTPNTGTFGNVAFRNESAVQSFVVSNGASNPMTGPIGGTFTGLPVTTTAGQDFYLVENGCKDAAQNALVLGAGASCTIKIKFAPAPGGLLGTHTRLVTVTAAPGGSVDLTLTGNATPTLTIDKATADFGAANTLGYRYSYVDAAGNTQAGADDAKTDNMPTQVFRITNNGLATVPVTAIVNAGQGQNPAARNFQIEGIACTSISAVAGMNFCDVTVRMVPRRAAAPAAGDPVVADFGLFTALLEVADNLGTPTMYTSATLSGTAISDADLQVTAKSAQPAVAGLETRLFGDVRLGATSAGSQLIVIENRGETASGPLNIEFTGGVLNTTVQTTPPADFVAVAPSSGTQCAAGASLAAGASCSLAYQFRPQATGQRDVTVRVYATNLNRGGSTDAVRLRGTGVAASDGFVNPSPFMFADTAPNSSSAAQTFTITGPSTTLTPSATTGFTVNMNPSNTVGACGAATSLASNVTCVFQVTFTPTVSGVQVATLSFTGGPSVVLYGRGMQDAILDIIPPVEGGNFGQQVINTTSAARRFTLKNIGEAATPVNQGVIVQTGSPTNFPLSASTCGAQLAPGGTCTFDVAFRPSAVQAYNGVNLTATAGAINATPEGVSGSGVNPATLTTTASSINFNTVAVGVTTAVGNAFDIPVSNPANSQTSGAITVQLSDPVNFIVNVNDCDQEALTGVPQATSCTLRAQFSPKSLPATNPVMQATVTITGTPGGSFTVNLIGTATSALTAVLQTPANANPAYTFTNAVTVGMVGTETAVFRFTNAAGAPTTGLLQVQKGGTNGADFKILTDGCVGKQLAAAGTCDITLALNPQTTGTGKTATIVVSATPGNSATATVTGSAQ